MEKGSPSPQRTINTRQFSLPLLGCCCTVRPQFKGFWAFTQISDGAAALPETHQQATTKNAWKSDLRTPNYKNKKFAWCVNGSGNSPSTTR